MTPEKLKKFKGYFVRKKYKVFDYLALGNKLPETPFFKEALFPWNDAVIEYNNAKQKEIFDNRKRVLLGVNILDLRALSLWHQVFEKDSFFQKRLRNTIIIGQFIAPVRKNDSGFLLDKFEEENLEHLKFDIFIIGSEKYYKIFTGSEEGQKILEDFGYTEYEHVDFMGLIKEEGMDEKVLKIKKKLKNRYVKKIWEKIGKKCLECGRCTYVCPTCFCFDIVEKPGFKKGKGVRSREWNSCLFPAFSQVTGGHKFQKNTAERLYFWYYHKFVRIPEEFNLPGCVGCGRCSRACPVGIDIVKVLDEILKS